MRNVDAVILRNLVKIRAIRDFERVDNIPDYALYLTPRRITVLRFENETKDESRRETWDGRRPVRTNRRRKLITAASGVLQRSPKYGIPPCQPRMVVDVVVNPRV